MTEKEPKKNGRPLKFANVTELQDAIDEYFKSCDQGYEPYTICGLALFLDTTRQLLMQYEHRDEFSDAVKRAKLRVENSYEKSLRGNNPTGSIFALKNFGWKDQSEVKSYNIEWPLGKSELDK